MGRGEKPAHQATLTSSSRLLAGGLGLAVSGPGQRLEVKLDGQYRAVAIRGTSSHEFCKSGTKFPRREASKSEGQKKDPSRGVVVRPQWGQSRSTGALV